MSDELLREIRDQTLKNTDHLERISERLDSHEDRMDEHEARIRWSHKKLNELSGWRSSVAWIAGAGGSAAALISVLFQTGAV